VNIFRRILSTVWKRCASTYIGTQGDKDTLFARKENRAAESGLLLRLRNTIFSKQQNEPQGGRPKRLIGHLQAYRSDRLPDLNMTTQKNHTMLGSTGLDLSSLIRNYILMIFRFQTSNGANKINYEICKNKSFATTTDLLWTAYATSYLVKSQACRLAPSHRRGQNDAAHVLCVWPQNLNT